MVWPLLRPFLAVTAVIVIVFSMIPEMYTYKQSSVHIFGATYDFLHKGHPAYVTASFSEATQYLCTASDLPDFTPICSSLKQIQIAGQIYFGMSCLVFLIQLCDLLQTALRRTKVFSSTSKIDVYGLSPIVYTLNLLIYCLVAGVFATMPETKVGLGGVFAVMALVLLISFAVVAMLLERKEAAAAKGPLQPLLLPLQPPTSEKEP